MFLLFILLANAQFSKIKPTAPVFYTDTSLASPLGSRNAAIWCSDDLLYIFGGKTNIGRTTNMWTFEEATNRWFRLPDGPQALSGTIYWKYKSYLWLYGGRTTANVSSTLYRYSIPDRKWSIITVNGITPGPRYGSIFWYLDTVLYLYGGRSYNHTIQQDMWTLDMKTMKWNLIYAMNEPGYLDDGKSVIDSSTGKVFIFGTNGLWSYKDMIWKSLEGPLNREDHIMWYNKQELFIIGGKRDKKVINDAWISKDSGPWKLASGTNPSNRWGSAMCKSYIYGGVTEDGIYLNDVWKYNENSETNVAFVIIIVLILVIFIIAIISAYIIKKKSLIQKV